MLYTFETVSIFKNYKADSLTYSSRTLLKRLHFCIAQELANLLANNGLQKILHVVRSQLQKSKNEFLESIDNRYDSFYSPDVIDNRIMIELWKNLEKMKCNYLCPWCGMPCCGTTNCNDKYTRLELPSPNPAKIKHSCHFHRDSAITGVGESAGWDTDEITDRSPNRGDCPQLIERETKWRIQNPENKDGPKIWVPTTYYDTTWAIKSKEDDPDKGSGLFWQWFLSFVSCQYYP